MAFLKVEIELEWLGLASICAFLIYIIYRKHRLPDSPKLSCDQISVRDECVKIADYFQRFLGKLDDAFEKLFETDVDDIQSLSYLRDDCKTTISGLIDECQYDGDVIKFVGDFAADLKNSRLFTLISDKDAEIDFQKAELLVSIEYLMKVCENIASLFTDLSNAPSTWFKDEKMKKMRFSKLLEVSRWLNEWRLASFFKAEKFKISDVGNYLKARIEQLSDKK